MYKTEANMPHGAIVASRMQQKDGGYIPRYKERVQYLIVNGQDANTKKKQALKDLAVSPQEFLEAKGGLTLNSEYYIRRLINPALNRIFREVFNIDVNIWFDLMPKQQRQRQQLGSKQTPAKANVALNSKSIGLAANQSRTLNQFYKSNLCQACEEPLITASTNLCTTCYFQNLPAATYLVSQRQGQAEKKV